MTFCFGLPPCHQYCSAQILRMRTELNLLSCLHEQQELLPMLIINIQCLSPTAHIKLICNKQDIQAKQLHKDSTAQLLTAGKESIAHIQLHVTSHTPLIF
jgi:hypothetical protein